MITHAASRKHYYTVLLDRTLGEQFFCQLFLERLIEMTEMPITRIRKKTTQ